MLRMMSLPICYHAYHAAADDMPHGAMPARYAIDAADAAALCRLIRHAASFGALPLPPMLSPLPEFSLAEMIRLRR